ncbi:MAG: nitroreductase family protein [Bacteroidetes bacterium]|nr:nitroreductase family protein [Bacteroidota bacterium]
MDIINKRRSIRSFTEQPVSQEIIDSMLHAAMNAPSAHNQQAWHFINITNRETMNTIAEFHPYAKMMVKASGAILVCGNKKLMKIEGLWEQDCAAATQNILLEAVYQGIGAVWVGISHVKEYKEMLSKLFNLPDNIIPFSLIPFGYPQGEKDPNNNYSSDKVSLDMWN